MILDNLNGYKKYKFCDSVNKALEFLKDSKEIQDGKYEFENGVFVNVQTIIGKEIEKARFEAHEKYIDIQVVLNGNEQMSYATKGTLIESKMPVKDVAFYACTAENELKLTNNDFAIFYAGEFHRPGIGNGTIKKAVIKVPKDLI